MNETSKPWEAISIEAEQALLGALLLNNSAFQYVNGEIEEEDFGEPIHGYIFRIISDLINSGKLADPKIVLGLIEDVEIQPGMTSKKYIARLAAEATTILNAVDYARHIHELSDRRKIARIGRDLAPREDLDAASMAAEAIDSLDAVASRRSTQGRAITMRQAVAEAVDATAKAYESDGRPMGVPFTLRDLDSKTGGMSAGDLVILGGRPGMGKSAMALTLLRRQAESGLKVMIASLEMSALALTQRMISDVIFDHGDEHMPYFYLRNGRFHERMFRSVTEAGAKLAELPITIDDRAGITMAQISARARQMKRRGGLDILCIDHLDLVKASTRYSGNRVYELAEVTSAAKSLAKELQIPILMLAQLNRVVETREDKRPTLADLRSSGSIEQDADTVIFLYRPSYYLQNSEPQAGTPEFENWQREMEANHNRLIAIVAKQRMGPAGNIELFCDIANNAVRDMDGHRR